MKTLNGTDCLDWCGPAAMIDPHNTIKTICAYSEVSGICSGDSGGPLIYNDTLIGVTSWTGQDAQTAEKIGFPIGFARVSEFIEWIESIMSKFN